MCEGTSAHGPMGIIRFHSVEVLATPRWANSVCYKDESQPVRDGDRPCRLIPNSPRGSARHDCSAIKRAA
jgi:hypothetical protein